jgi:O-antigen/teichoic acid export membrane protein
MASPPGGFLRLPHLGGLVQRFGAITVARLIGLAATLVQLPLLTSSLEPAQYALVAAAIASGAYVSLASVEPATLAFQRFPGTAEARGSYARAQRQLLLSTPVVLAGVLVVGLLVDVLWVCAAAAGWGLGLAWMRLTSTAWLMWDAPWRYAYCLTGSTVLRTATLCGAVLAGVPPEIAVASAGLLSAFVALALRPRVFAGDVPDQVAPVSLGVSLAVSSLAVAVLQGADKVILPMVADAHSAGQYAAMSNLTAYSLTAVLGVVSTAFFAPTLRLWEEGAQTTAVRRVDLAASATLGFGAFACSGALLVGEWLTLVVGAAYLDVRVLAALMTAAALLAAGQFHGWLYQFRLTTTSLQRRSWLAALLMTALLVPGGAMGGERGAAAAVVVGCAIYAIALQQGNSAGLFQILLAGVVAAGGVLTLSDLDRPAMGAAVLLAAVVVLMTLGRLARTARARRSGTSVVAGSESPAPCP